MKPRTFVAFAALVLSLPGIGVAAELPAQFGQAFEQVQAKLVKLVVNAPLLVVAIAIVLFSLWLGGFVSRRMRVLTRISRSNPYMDGLLRNTVKSMIALAGVLVALNLLNATALVSAVLPKKNAPKPVPRPEVEMAAAEAKPADPVVPVLVEHGYAEPIAARWADIAPVASATVEPPAGWAVQVAASQSEDEARAALARTNERAAAIVADASSYTVTFDKDGVTYYRARFGQRPLTDEEAAAAREQLQAMLAAVQENGDPRAANPPIRTTRPV